MSATAPRPEDRPEDRRDGGGRTDRTDRAAETDHRTSAHHTHHHVAATWAEAKAEQDEFEAALVQEHGDWEQAVEDVIEGRTPEHPPPAPGPPA